MPLGFEPSLLLNDPAGREFRAAMAKNLENVGKQVQDGITRIVQNREARAFGEQLRGIDPNSETFAQDLVGAIDEHPMGATSKQGILAINLLGAQHKNWLRDQQRTTGAQFSALPGGRGVLNRFTGEVEQVPEEMLPKDKPILRSGPGGAVRQLTPNAQGGFDVTDVIAPQETGAKKETPETQVKRLNSLHSQKYSQFRALMTAANTADKDAFNAEQDAMESGASPEVKARASDLRKRADSAARRANDMEREMNEITQMIDGIMQGGFAETGAHDRSAAPASNANPEALITEQPPPPGTPPARLRYNPQTGNFE